MKRSLIYTRQDNHLSYYSKVIKGVYYQEVIFWGSIHLEGNTGIFFFQINEH